MKQALVLALGSVNADFQVRVERRPEISETLLARDFVRLSGGKSANVAFLARKFGLPARLIAQVGDDDLANQALGALRAAEVDLSLVRRVSDTSTGVAFILVPPDGKKGIVMAANANQCWERAQFDPVLQAIREAPAGSVLVTNCEIPAWAVEAAMQAARAAGAVTVLDPSPADATTEAMLAYCDLIIPNAGEAKALTGVACDSPAQALKAARQLCKRGARAAAVKLEDGGCVLLNGDGELHIGTVEVEVVDTTGAGDAFAGGLAAALVKGESLQEATALAVAASHLSVRAYGSQPAYPEWDEVTRLAARLPQTDNLKEDSNDAPKT